MALRIALFLLGIYLAYAGVTLIHRMLSAGYAGDAFFLYTHYRYGVSKQATMIGLTLVTVLGFGLLGWSLKGK